MTILLLCLWLIAAATGSQKSRSGNENGMKQRRQIVFVCEHGAALSVVSAAWFNKIARQEHLALHAIARGVTPQKDLAVSARDGLKADGVSFETRKPQALSVRDVAQARRIIAFYPLPSRYSATARVETWDDVPPTGTNYGLSRDAIIKHLRQLIGDLKSEADANGSESGNR